MDARRSVAEVVDYWWCVARVREGGRAGRREVKAVARERESSIYRRRACESVDMQG